MGIPNIEQLDKEVKESAERGNLCSQIVVDVGLKHLNLEDGEVIKAVGGLVGAQGLMGATCGSLTAAACLIATAWKNKEDKDRMYMLIQEVEERFNSELISQYPGNRCDDLLEADPTKLPTEVCPPVIAGTIRLALELLQEEGYKVN